MGMTFVRIDMPPGAVEAGEGTAPTDEQMQKEQEARQEFLDFVEPRLEALTARPLRRAGNIVRVELLGGYTWSTMNRYLAFVSTDIGDPGVDWADLVPKDANVSVLESGAYRQLHEWPERAEA